MRCLFTADKHRNKDLQSNITGYLTPELLHLKARCGRRVILYYIF